MLQEDILCKSAPDPIGNSSQAIKVGDYIFVAGQLAMDCENGIISDDIAEQTCQCMRNIEAVLKEAGISLEYILRTTMYLTDPSYFETADSAYQSFFHKPFPARSIAYVNALPYGAKVQIEAFAIDTRALEVLCAQEKKCNKNVCSMD